MAAAFQLHGGTRVLTGFLNISRNACQRSLGAAGDVRCIADTFDADSVSFNNGSAAYTVCFLDV